jgi:hypothetical protein
LRLTNCESTATRPRVLILAQAFPPAPVSGAARAGRFAKFLPRFGYEPLVVCGGEPTAAEDPASVRRVPKPTSGRTVRFLAALGDIAQRYLLPYNDQIPWAVHAAGAAEAVMDECPVAAILSTSPPVGAHLAALWLRRRHGVPWVADFRDPLAGNPFRGRWWPFPYDTIVERLVFSRADALVANTDALAEMWGRRCPGAAGKVSVIWNGFDPEDRARPVPLPPRAHRVLVHAGSIYENRHPGALLASLARLVGRRALTADRFRVQFVGYVEEACMRNDPGSLEALLAWGCLEYDGRTVPPEQARRASAEADYLLLLDLNERDTSLQVPGKLFEYLQIGRPILAFTRRDSPTDRILRRGGVPHRTVYADDGDDEVDRKVLSLFDIAPVPVPASDWFEENFDGRNQADALALVLDRLRGAVDPGGWVSATDRRAGEGSNGAYELTCG